MSCPYTSPQNGKAERMIRTTNDVVRTLLIQASLPPRFRAESLHTATYLLNRLLSTASPAPTPHHALFGTPPRYDHLLTPPPLLLTNWRPAQLVVCSLVTPLTTRGTDALISPLAAS